MPSTKSATTTEWIMDDNSLKDKVDTANVLTYVVIALACIVGLMIVLFVVCKIRNIRKKKKMTEMRRFPREKPARPGQTVKRVNGLSPRQIHPRINQLKKEELVFTRSDSGYTSNQSTPRNKRSRKLRDSHGIEAPQNEAWGENSGKPRAKPSPKIRGTRSQAEAGESIEIHPVQTPGRQLSLVDNLDF